MSESLTIVLARSRDDIAARCDLEARLLARLSSRPGVQVVLTAHLYDLPDEGEATRRLREVSGGLVVLAWMPVRAIRATTAWRIGWGSETESTSDSRRLWCFDLGQYRDAETCLSKLEAILPDASTHHSPGEPIVVDEPTYTRWYPVVDTSRCIGCLECLNFCLFGVFGLDGSEKLLIEQPDACRPGCPACARVCPAGAIMFPEHADPVIAGAAPSASDPTKLDILPFAPQTMPSPQAGREHDAAVSEEQSPGGSPPREAELDDLVDRLDELDL